MKRLTLVAGLALVGSALTIVPSLHATAVAPRVSSATPSIVSKMKADATGSTEVSVEKATGKVGFIRTSPRQGPAARRRRAPWRSRRRPRRPTPTSPSTRAAFGAAKGQLHRTSVSKNAYGVTVSYKQRYQGVPVFGSRILANLDNKGNLRSGQRLRGSRASTSP